MAYDALLWNRDCMNFVSLFHFIGRDYFCLQFSLWTMLANVSLLFHIIWIFQRLKINHIGTTYINVHRTVLQILYPFIFDMSKISIILFAKSFFCGTTFIGKPSNLTWYTCEQQSGRTPSILKKGYKCYSSAVELALYPSPVFTCRKE